MFVMVVGGIDALFLSLTFNGIFSFSFWTIDVEHWEREGKSNTRDKIESGGALKIKPKMSCANDSV